MENLALNSKFNESLQCPVCKDFFTPPILLCTSGHSICTPCVAKSSNCPTCRSPLTSRNIVLEGILEQVTVPCKHPGCQQTVTLSNRQAHSNACPFNKTMKCLECNLSQSDLLEHLVSVHGYKEIHMSSTGGIRSFSGPYESWREDTMWPRGIWRLDNDPLVVHAKSKKGVFHIYLYRLNSEPITITLSMDSADYSIKFKGNVPSVSEFENQTLPHFNCDINLLLKTFLKMHEDDPEILRLWVSVKRK